MTSLYDGHDFYKRMLELQEKLRKSEEERIRLEERFNFLERESHSRHEACINKLRMRYIEFLEEQRFRDERNNKLLNTLDRVDTNLVLMNAKTDRLYILRKEYEASILRAFTSRRHPPSITGDSGIVSHNDDRILRREIHNPRYNCGRSILSSPIPSSIPGSVYSFSTFPTVNLDFERATPSYLIPRTLDRSSQFNRSRFLDPVNNLRENYASHFIGNMKNKAWDKNHLESRYRGDYPTTYNYRLSNLDNNFVRRNYSSPSTRDTLSLRYPETHVAPKTSKLSAIISSSREERAGKILENELERYISKIRDLHGEIIPQNLEEIDNEENTSGDLLNVTLSDDGLEHLPIEDKKQKHISKEVENILALADDLASRTVENRKIKSDIFPDTRQNSKDQVGIHQNDLQQKRENSAKVRSAPFNRNWLKVQQQFPTKIQIGDGIAKDVIKINRSQRNIEAITNSRSIVESNDFNDHNLTKITPQTGEHLNNVENLKIPQQQLENWNTGNVENEMAGVVANFTDGNLVEASTVENKQNLDGNPETEVINSQIYDENEGNKNVDYESTGDGYQGVQIDQSYNQDPQVYQDQNQEYSYSNQDYQQDPQYHYDQDVNYEQNQNVNYEQDPNVEYQYDQQYSQYPADPNAQQYPDDSQYTEDPNQYQYSEDPNQQYPAEYSQDPNQQYDPNYAYNYDENQTYQEQGNYEVYEENAVADDQVIIETTDNKNQQSVKNTIDTKKNSKDVIKSILDSDTDSTIEKNVSNTESDFDFN